MIRVYDGNVENVANSKIAPTTSGSAGVRVYPTLKNDNNIAVLCERFYLFIIVF